MNTTDLIRNAGLFFFWKITNEILMPFYVFCFDWHLKTHEILALCTTVHSVCRAKTFRAGHFEIYFFFFLIFFFFFFFNQKKRFVTKGSIFLKKRHVISKKGLINWYMVLIQTIIKCGSWQPVKFQLVSCSRNEMIFYRISELMLPTLIQRYDKKSFHFLSSSKPRD